MLASTSAGRSLLATGYWLLPFIRKAADGDAAGARDVVDAEGPEHLDEGFDLLAVARRLDDHARVRDVHDLRAEDRDEAQDLLPGRARPCRHVDERHLA